MTTVDDLWYLADEASQQAEQTYHRLLETYEDVSEYEATKGVSRRRFRTVAERIQENGAPYGSHTLTYHPDGKLLLVRHDGVEKWVLPGGEAEDDETFREAAERELAEEAGLTATYVGLEILARVTFRSDGHETWGIMPIFAARTTAGDPEVCDPDDEISQAAWFRDLPEDTRDRQILAEWLADRRA